jgi:hypothetical protein
MLDSHGVIRLQSNRLVRVGLSRFADANVVASQVLSTSAICDGNILHDARFEFHLVEPVFQDIAHAHNTDET